MTAYLTRSFADGLLPGLAYSDDDMELAHLRYRKRSYEAYVGKRGLELRGKK